MYYMAAFWILMVAILIFDYIIKKRISEKAFRTGIMWLVSWAIGFLVVGIITRDPVFSFWGVPSEFEWVVGVVLGVLVVWNYLFNPLQDRVGDLEKDMVAVRTGLGSVTEDVALIKSKVIRV